MRGHSAQYEGARVLVITRDVEDSRQYIDALKESGFQLIQVSPLDQETAELVLSQVGIREFSPSLVELGRTLIDLDLVARVYRIAPQSDLQQVGSTVALWREYFRVVKLHESVGAGNNAGRELYAEAVTLAWASLKSAERTITLPINTTRPQQRLVCLGHTAPSIPVNPRLSLPP